MSSTHPLQSASVMPAINLSEKTGLNTDAPGATENKKFQDAGAVQATVEPRIDRWVPPSASSPLPSWPRGGFGGQFDANKPGFNASFTPLRQRPTVQKAQEGATSPAEVVKPTLNFNAFCPLTLQADIHALFKQVVAESIGYGLGDKKAKEFHVKYITRRQWSEFLVDRDNELAKKFPSSGLRSWWTRLTRFLARLAHTFTTPIYFDRDFAGDILIVDRNFGRNMDADKRRMLAEVMVRCLQRSTYSSFFELHARSLGQLNADPEAYSINEALAEINVQVCLQALERNQGVALYKRPWFSWLRRSPKRLRAPEQAIVERLSAEKDADGLFRRMFSKPYWAAFLFKKGGSVEVSKNPSPEDEAFIVKAREINPYGPPRLKR